jgi:hypothetical protein
MPPLDLFPQSDLADSSLQGEIGISVDRDKNLIRVVGRGLWSLGYARAHVREFEAVLRESRCAYLPSRTLVDLRESPIQSPQVAAYLQETISRMYQPPERAAIVVSSSLIKLTIQVQHKLNSDTHAVFASLKAAESWLLA